MFPKAQGTTAVRLRAVAMQTSCYGAAIPVGWGRGRLKASLVWYNNFIAHTVKTTAGGKGGGGGKNTSYTYTADLILALASGPIQAVRRVFADKQVYTNGASTALAQVGLSLALGNQGQSPWGYLATNYPSQSIGYSELSYVYAANYNLGAGGALPNHSFEIDFATQFNGTIGDANPKDVFQDFFTNAFYGVPGWPSGALGDLTVYSTYCKAAGMFVSPVLESQQSAASFLQELLLASNSDCVWSEGVLKVVPYGDTACTANSTTYTPSLTPVFNLTKADFLVGAGEDPVVINIRDQSDAFNTVSVEFLNRTLHYNVDSVPAQDNGNIALYGRRKAQPISLHMVCDPAVARALAQLALQRSLYVRNQYKFKTDWSKAALEPMDLVTLTEPGVNLASKLVRIVDIEDDDDGRTITAEEMLVGTGATPTYAQQAAGGYVPTDGALPGSVQTAVLFNAPSSLTAGATQIWVAAASNGANWGGAEVWLSTDGTTYNYSGDLVGPSRMGVLTANYGLNTDPDTTHTMAVDLTLSAGQLVSATAAQADNGNTLCIVGAELMSYQDANLTSAFHYNLTTRIRRGLFGTTIAAHLTNDIFVRLDGQVAKVDYSPQAALLNGGTLYVKLLSFNLKGLQRQALSDVSAYTVSIAPNSVNAQPITSVTCAHTTVTSSGQVMPAIVVGFNKPTDPFATGVRISYRVVGSPAGTQTATIDIPKERFGANPQSITIFGNLLGGVQYEAAVATITNPATTPAFSSYVQASGVTAGSVALAIVNQSGMATVSGVTPTPNGARYSALEGGGIVGWAILNNGFGGTVTVTRKIASPCTAQKPGLNFANTAGQNGQVYYGAYGSDNSLIFLYPVKNGDRVQMAARVLELTGSCTGVLVRARIHDAAGAVQNELAPEGGGDAVTAAGRVGSRFTADRDGFVSFIFYVQKLSATTAAGGCTIDEMMVAKARSDQTGLDPYTQGQSVINGGLNINGGASGTFDTPPYVSRTTTSLTFASCTWTGPNGQTISVVGGTIGSLSTTTTYYVFWDTQAAAFVSTSSFATATTYYTDPTCRYLSLGAATTGSGAGGGKGGQGGIQP